MRLAAGHLALGWQVIVIDAKEDHETAQRFANHARNAGLDQRRIRTWPASGAIDICRGPAAALRDRLMACAAWTEPYYRSVAATLLTLVCDDPTGPPGSMGDVLQRLDTTSLKTRWAGSDRGPLAAGISANDVQGVRFWYFCLGADLESVGAIDHLGGGWSWEDSDASWITLPTSTRSEVAAAFGRALLVDLIGYIRDPARRADMKRPILLVIEELGAIVSADPATANLVIEAVERARPANVRTVVSVQTPEGLGDISAQARILHGGAAVLAHRMPNPEIISELVGTSYGLEAGLGVDAAGRFLDHGSVREQHQFRLPPSRLRTLPTGQAVFIHAGQWMHVAIPLLAEHQS